MDVQIDTLCNGNWRKLEESKGGSKISLHPSEMMSYCICVAELLLSR